MPDDSESQIEQLAQAIGDSYKQLDSGNRQQVVVAYGAGENSQQSNDVEDVMVKDESGVIACLW